MTVELRSDYPVTDDACRAATGKSLQEWSAALAEGGQTKRRDSIMWICDQTSRTVEGVWWATTIWVTHEEALGKVQKDGRPEGYNICSTKTIAADVGRVQAAIASMLDRITRQREGKDIRASWRTPGIDADTEVEVLFNPTDGKTGVMLYHKRIQSREEADGLRRAWSDALAKLKQELEGK